MTDLYTAAMRRQPALWHKAQLQRRRDREEAQGVHGLFDLLWRAMAARLASALV